MTVRFATPLIALALIGCAVDTDGDLLPVDQAAAPIALELSATAAAAGDISTFTVQGLAPQESVTILRSNTNAIGDGECSPAIGGECIDILGDIAVAGTATADATGTATFDFGINASVAVGVEKGFQAVAVRGANSVVSNPIRLRAGDNGARLRAVHASPDAPNVDIYANGALLLPNVPFGAASGWLNVPAGDYTVDIRGAGADANSTPVYSVDLSLDADESYTAVATGFLGSTSSADQFRVIPLVDDWGNIDPEGIRVRILHGSPDAPTVGLDVFNDGTLDVPALPLFGETGATGVALPAETALAVGVTTTAGDPVTSFSLPALPAGEEIIVIASGELGAHPASDTGFSLLALFRDGTTATIKQDPVVYALHASPGAPEVDVLVGGGVIVDDLGFRDISAPVQVPPGMYTLDIQVAADGSPVDSFGTPMLEAGQRYLVTATGFVGGDPGFQLLVTQDQFDREDTNGRTRVVHASPDAPAVDIGFVNGGAFAAGLFDVPFGAQTFGRGLITPPGTYNLGIAVAGTGQAAFTFSGLGFVGGERLIALATGSLGADFGLTLVDTNASPWETFTVDPD